MGRSKLAGWVAAGFLLLILNTAYVWAFATASIFYMANVALHVALGLGVAAGAVALYRGRWREAPAGAAGAFIIALALGVFLTIAGATRDHRWALWGHIAAALVGVALLAPLVIRRRAFRAALAVLLVLPLAANVYRRVRPDPNYRIENPTAAPASMNEEGGGPKSPFFPSSAKTNVGGIIPSNFFMDSQKCGECHKDIYEQWKSSMHHFASFNNQFYRKSVEHMQSVVGTQPSKWCAGCHDHAVFFNGRFEKPIAEQIDTPEAHAGLACTSCHSITHVAGSMGNGGFTIEYPPLHELASSSNPAIRVVDRFLTYLDPEPHRRTFLKPFMKQNAEFCSACHKVHLDVPVNAYRWIRGFNDYDNWQASGVSGQGARSFYYPAKTMTCVNCHMPLVDSKDPGNIDGKVHSHRFPAANTAVSYVNRDEAQLKAEQAFLKSGFITVDIFAASPVDENAPAPMLRRSGEGPLLSSTFAVGEEAEQPGQVFLRDVGKVTAPINAAGARFQPGSTVRVDVVARTRAIGHFFPGGTVDAFDVWLELQAEDARGKTIYWSGSVEDGGRGPVEPGAHFYKSFQIDGEGNPINKRNAWQARSTLYVRLIPPGAADVAHYRVRIPPDAKGPITLTARLNHRKFSHYYTKFSYAGVAKPGEHGRDFDNREFTFEPVNIPKNVSGQIKGEIPVLPITVLAQAETKLELGDTAEWRPVVRKQDRERWNDWGIGLLLQGDLKGAEYAFLRVTEAEPEYADGWLNVARALIQEGETEAAKPYIERALKINPKLGRIHFFKAMIEKADGDYDAALASLRRVEAQYPRDRVTLNQIGRILFLKREYAEAIRAFERVCAVDPEDVQAHYNLMLCYRGVGDVRKAQREEMLFKRFKADEASQTLTAKPRLLSPEDNNERQLIHEHESVNLAAVGR
ncbi:MAG: tetratricopeptide repeat protein [Acidobacteriota bacterium]